MDGGGIEGNWLNCCKSYYEFLLEFIMYLCVRISLSLFCMFMYVFPPKKKSARILIAFTLVGAKISVILE